MGITNVQVMAVIIGLVGGWMFSKYMRENRQRRKDRDRNMLFSVERLRDPSFRSVYPPKPPVTPTLREVRDDTVPKRRLTETARQRDESDFYSTPIVFIDPSVYKDSSAQSCDSSYSSDSSDGGGSSDSGGDSGGSCD